jgi:hypothetical protein
LGPAHKPNISCLLLPITIGYDDRWGMMLVGGAGEKVMWVVRSSISVIRRREWEAERESPSSLAEVVGVHPLHLVGALQ